MHESSGPKHDTMHTQQSGIRWENRGFRNPSFKGYVDRPKADQWQYLVMKIGEVWIADVDDWDTGDWQNLDMGFDTLEEAKQWCEIHWLTVGFQG